MDSKLVVTYKRKRLFSRRDNDCTDLNPDAPSETSESKTLKKVNNREESTTAEYVLRNKDTEFGIRQEYSEGNLVEDVVQCEFCDSNGECSELQRLLSACTKQQDSSVSDQNEKDAKKIKLSPISDVEQITFQPNLLSEGNSAAEEKSAEPQSKLLFVKPSSEYGDKSEEKKSILSPPILGTLNLEETNKISKDQRSSSCSNLVTKRRLDSNLITFRRRVKRNNNVATHGIDSKDAEKKQSDVDIANSCSFSAPAPETAVIAHVDESPHLPQDTAKDTPADVAREEILSSAQGNDSMDAQNSNHHINDVKPENIPNDDVDTVKVPSDASGKKDSLLPLDLSISPHAALDIDCNRPLDCGSDENHSIPTALRDKGKFVIDQSPPTSVGPTPSKNNYFQLFPENRTNDVAQKVGPLRPPPTSQHSSYFNSGHAAYSSPNAWPNIQLQQQQPREAFHEFLQQPNLNRAESSFSRQKMTMLDNALTRARAVRGSNRSSFLDRFEPPIIWSEEELDCLWIGVRRHGKGNWDSIRMDRRLIFSPWKTAHDLAERWLHEQARIFSYNNPVPQVHYAGPPDHWSSHFTNPLGEARQSYGGGSHQRPLLHHPPTTNNKKLEKQSTNVGSSSNAGQVKGNLPHWLKEAVQIPSCGMRWQNQPNFQSTEYPNKRATTTTNAPLVIGNVSKKKELIVITSDASSEETISDDRGGRP
ncbi:hypothetical protein ACP275_11G022800 [Erythranthe tilingii]